MSPFFCTFAIIDCKTMIDYCGLFNYFDRERKLLASYGYKDDKTFLEWLDSDYGKQIFQQHKERFTYIDEKERL